MLTTDDDSVALLFSPRLFNFIHLMKICPIPQPIISIVICILRYSLGLVTEPIIHFVNKVGQGIHGVLVVGISPIMKGIEHMPSFVEKVAVASIRK